MTPTLNPQTADDRAKYRRMTDQLGHLGLDTAVPESVRALAEKSVAQTRQAYDRSLDAFDTSWRLSRRYPPRKAALGPYHVVAQLPPRDGQLQYRIKSGCEPFYRTATENELESDLAASAAIAAS